MRNLVKKSKLKPAVDFLMEVGAVVFGDGQHPLTDLQAGFADGSYLVHMDDIGSMDPIEAIGG